MKVIRLAVKVKSVKHDVAKKRVTITLETDEGALVEATELAEFVEAGKLEATFSPEQMRMELSHVSSD